MDKPPNIPDDPDDLGLPKDYNPEHIPSKQQLQYAAQEALHRISAFIIGNKNDDPQAIIDRLPTMAATLLAAVQVTGPHQVKAIKLALELRPFYGPAYTGEGTSWFNLIAPMLVKAADIGSNELESEIYRGLSAQHYNQRNVAGARKVLVAALEAANDSGREDLTLLICTERFHYEIAGKSLVDARAEALPLLQDAWRLRYTYVLARIYHSLAWKCREVSDTVNAFNYDQQAFLFAAQVDDPILMGECLNTLLNNLNRVENRSGLYIDRLQSLLEQQARRSGRSLFAGAMDYYLAMRLYHQGDYDRARDLALKAWLSYRRYLLVSSAKRVEHMLGMIQTKRRSWPMASRHLQAAQDYYEEVGDRIYTIHARHALAHLLMEQGAYDLALANLDSLMTETDKITEATSRDELKRYITQSIAEAHDHADAG